jgi:uncharacterized protein YfkK (UPF0435 family)
MIMLDQNLRDTENLTTLIEEIKSYLNVVNAAVIQAEDYSLDHIDELSELNDYVKKKQGKLTLMEIEGVLDELRNLRNK